MSDKITKTTHLTVIKRPKYVLYTCPHCSEEILWRYDDFCVTVGGPADWSYLKLNCENCNKEIEIRGAEWV